MRTAWHRGRTFFFFLKPLSTRERIKCNSIRISTIQLQINSIHVEICLLPVEKKGDILIALMQVTLARNRKKYLSSISTNENTNLENVCS